jgi:hypothetical protein
MTIAPITGKLRKRFWLDVGTALGLGLTGGYSYWYVVFCTNRIYPLSKAFVLRYGVHLKARKSQPLKA